MGDCVTPAPRKDVTGDGRWMSIHNRYVAETKTAEPDVVLIGDSIIQNLIFSNLWNDKIIGLHCLNFGIGGDKVEHVLWRLLNGEMDFSVTIKAVVLYVGTNNTNDKAEDVFEGILECLKVIKNKLGDVHIVLPTLLPRGQNPNHLRERIEAVNKLILQKFENNPNSDFNHVHVVPIHEDVIQSNGTISHFIMHDYLHLTNQGYTDIFTPVYEKLYSIVNVKKSV